MMLTKIQIIYNANGTFSFVGRVPANLAFTTSATGELKNKLMNIAHQVGASIAERIARREGHSFKTRVFPTKEAAREEAIRLGFKELLAEE